MKTDLGLLKVHERAEPTRRPTLYCSLIPGQRKFAPIYYNLRSCHNFKMAILNRINLCPHVGCVDNSVISDVVSEIVRVLAIPPIPIQTRSDIEQWLEGRPYTRLRKTQIGQCLKELDDYDISNLNLSGTVNCFIKNETYPGIKPPRLIASRSDRDKCLLGPYFHHIDEFLFNSQFSVKHIPYSDRPKIINERFSTYLSRGWKVFCGDYTSFECSANRSAQLMFEYQFYYRIFPRSVCDKMVDVLLSPHTKLAGYALGSAITTPVRFSGEMNTSCGNTLYNLIALMYSARMCGFESYPIVEGDDSMICIPPDLDIQLFVGYLEQCGLVVKYDVFDQPGQAGYCSSFWEDDSARPSALLSDALLNITYANKSMTDRFGHRIMLESKLSSYMIQYPHNPVFVELAKHLNIHSQVIERFNSYRYQELVDSGVDLRLDGEFMRGECHIDYDYNETDLNNMLRFNKLTWGDFDLFVRTLDRGDTTQAIDVLINALLEQPGIFYLDENRCYRPARNVPSQ